jgi:CBS domain-containing protein
MQVSEVMHKGVITVQINDSIKRVASIMKREDIGSVPVYKNERPVGFVTDRDIVISALANGHNIDDPISFAMKSEIVSIRENEDISVATSLMEKNQISRLLVVNDGEQPVGMLTLHDIALVSGAKEIKAEMIDNIKH